MGGTTSGDAALNVASDELYAKGGVWGKHRGSLCPLSIFTSHW